ncbi:MAG: amylo-alpha-1,6-glucosidase, partial [Cyanobacteria bacterium SZAS LIN-2]|nr:amylo-alpha-1,6-glucosidase [Cyanobacteria bacterium SZAS LIN-2]
MYPSTKPMASSHQTEAPIDQTTDQTQRRLVVKHQNQFLLLDLQGGMGFKNGAGLGLYVNDTRFLSQWEMLVGGQAPHFLSANAEEGFTATLTYSNKAASDLPANSLSIKREIVVDEKEIVSETITLENHLDRAVEVPLSLAFAADFADMFEVRGNKRVRRGFALPAQVTNAPKSLTGRHFRRSVTLSYQGLDNIVRQTRISFSGAGQQRVDLTESSATFNLVLEPKATVTLQARITTAEKGSHATNHGRRFDFARTRPESAARIAARARRAYDKWTGKTARIATGNGDFNRLLERSLRDIYLLRQDTANGQAVAAGVPWFAVPFGRDSLIAGLQTLPFMPELSRDIITFLAAYQGRTYCTETGEKPGRIMHELRPGEMAGLAEIPFRPYYGTVDATQLWLMLFSRYVQWSGDLEFARKMWPNAQAALNYLGRETVNSIGNMSGFIRYGETAGAALSNQGWKDSGNCIVYSNGQLATAPIAVCEAQGYLYAAWRETAQIASQLGFARTATGLEDNAAALKKKFNRDFWMDEHNTVAIALDRHGKRCDVVSSNAGHLLGTGILSTEREKLVAERLMQDDMFSGWGIRTLASSAAAYQPMDYQVGAVWPHDNGMIAYGMYQIGESRLAHKVVKAMLDVAVSQSDMRLPELFAGFARGTDKQPVPYQVACVPQLWAAGCAFHMVAGMLGLSYDHAGRTLK